VKYAQELSQPHLEIPTVPSSIFRQGSLTSTPLTILWLALELVLEACLLAQEECLPVSEVCPAWEECPVELEPVACQEVKDSPL